MEADELRQTVLDLGQEGLIPLWEAGQAFGVARVNAPEQESAQEARLELLAGTLADLAQSRIIRVFVGPWEDDDPREVTDDEALLLLRDRRRYVVEQELADDLDRVYFVNIENLPF